MISNRIRIQDFKCKLKCLGDGEKKCSPINKCLDPSKNQCNNATTICKMVPKKADYFCECLPGYDPPQGVSGVYYSCNGNFVFNYIRLSIQYLKNISSNLLCSETISKIIPVSWSMKVKFYLWFHQNHLFYFFRH